MPMVPYTRAIFTTTGKIFIKSVSASRISAVLISENHYRIYQVREALTRRLEREPTPGEMAAEMGISIEELVMTMESGAEVESLHKTIYQGEGTEISLMDKLPEKENRQEKVLDRIFLEEILGTLEAKERGI